MAIKKASRASLIATGKSAKGSRLTFGYFPSTDEMEFIQRATVGAGGVTNITLSNIPQTYQHLHLRYSLQYSGAGTYSSAYVTLNNDNTELNYWRHCLVGYGTNSIASQYNTWMTYHYITASGAISGNFGAGYVDILDYTSTAKKKCILSVNGTNNAGLGADDYAKGTHGITSGMWNSTAAITSITFNSSFSQYSTIALYGMKA